MIIVYLFIMTRNTRLLTYTVNKMVIVISKSKVNSMKKFFMTVVMLISFSFTTFANLNDYNKFTKIDNTLEPSFVIKKDVNMNYNFEFNYNELIDYLNLDKELGSCIISVHEGFCDGMILASQAANNEIRDLLIYNSINVELRGMKSILSEKQYRMFLRLFNVSIKSRGFSEIVDSYDLKNVKK